MLIYASPRARNTIPMLIRCLTLLCASLLVGSPLLAQNVPDTGLPPRVTELLAKANLPAEAMGGVVIRLSDGATLVSHNAERSLQPASTMKLLSTIVGLHKLGPLFRGRTSLLSNAELDGSTLKGDLVLRGGGDTDLNTEVLQNMLQTLRQQGILKIRGDLIIDRHLFQPARLDIGLVPFDEAPEFRYNVIPDALLLNLNLLKLSLASDQTTLRANILPLMDGVVLTHDMQLIDAPCKDWDAGWLPPTVSTNARGRIEIKLHGTYPKNCSKLSEINVLDRTEFAARLFRRLWQQMGGSFSGQVREALTPPDARLLTEHVSRPLSTLVRDINKESDNTFARMLFLNMGTFSVDSAVAGNASLLAAEPSSTIARADREVRRWLTEQGISTTGLVIDNGSGLSRSERITAQQLAELLLLAHASPWAPEFKASLPLAGMDGGMLRRLKDSPAIGRARIKTGTLRNVVAVAGYVLDSKGRECVVVGMINSDSMQSAAGRAILDSLIDWTARSGE